MLDFVPNHTAPDHPWVKVQPGLLCPGKRGTDWRRAKKLFAGRDRSGASNAHGRDPNYPGWPDTLQLDYANPQLQKSLVDELIAIAGKCDGVRCDMAMLVLPEVFQRTWGVTSEPFWPKATAAVRRAHPAFTFLGGGLLGPRMDAATAGLRLLL